jgi:RES domain-containing protein
MLVYRIGKAQYCNDLSGLGAKLYGGRWNRIGIPCVYTSQSRSLALLEYSVNIGFEFIKHKLCFTIIEIQDYLIEAISQDSLPNNWKAIPASSSTKTLGSDKLIQTSSTIIKVPSVIIPNEFNFIINPTNLDSDAVKIVAVEEYIYDYRIKN